jgi:hypothetical protein
MIDNDVTTLGATLAAVGWAPSEYADGTFAVDFGPPHMPVADAHAAVIANTRQFVLYINLGLAAPPDRRTEVARFITEANWGLTIGNFELDLGDGHVRFKSSVAYGDAGLSPALIRTTIYWAVKAVELYAEPLVEVIAGRTSCDAAIVAVER